MVKLPVTTISPSTDVFQAFFNAAAIACGFEAHALPPHWAPRTSKEETQRLWGLLDCMQTHYLDMVRRHGTAPTMPPLDSATQGKALLKFVHDRPDGVLVLGALARLEEQQPEAAARWAACALKRLVPSFSETECLEILWSVTNPTFCPVLADFVTEYKKTSIESVADLLTNTKSGPETEHARAWRLISAMQVELAYMAQRHDSPVPIHSPLRNAYSLSDLGLHQPWGEALASYTNHERDFDRLCIEARDALGEMEVKSPRRAARDAAHVILRARAIRGLPCDAQTCRRTLQEALCTASIDPQAMMEHLVQTDPDRAVWVAGQANCLAQSPGVVAGRILHDAAWRLAGSQLVKAARDVLHADFAHTPLGMALLSAMLSVPAEEVSPRLGDELRVRALAGAGDALVDLVMGPLREVLTTTLRDVHEATVVPTLDAGRTREMFVRTDAIPLDVEIERP